MSVRPELNKDLDAKTFREFYYLKEELVDFCRENNLPVYGSKIELTERIACFLETGKALKNTYKRKSTANIDIITEDTKIEENKLKELQTKNIDLLLLPEMSFTGFSMNTEITKENAHIIAPLLEEIQNLDKYSFKRYVKSRGLKK